MTFLDLFLSAVERAPNRIFLTFAGADTTYDQHRDRVGRAAAALAGLGVGGSDRVAILARNCAAYVELCHACLVGAGVLVPMNFRSSAAELAHVLSETEPTVLFASDEFWDLAQHALSSSGHANRPQLVRLEAPTGAVPVTATGEDDYPHLVADAEYRLPPPPADDDVAFIMYTSGSSGRPKGVVIEQRALVNDIAKIGSPGRLNQGYSFLLSAPLFHIASLRGFGLTFVQSGRLFLLPSFVADDVVEALHTHRVEWTGFVSSAVRGLLARPDFTAENLPHLRAISLGSAAMPGSVLDELRAAFPDVELLNWYGMTEACGHVTVLDGAGHASEGERRYSCGTTLPGCRLRITESSGRPVPTGTVGEIWVSGDNLMRGYLHGPPLPTDEHGRPWHRTGDFGRVDAEGYLYLEGRGGDRIVTGGENVSSAEVEAALLAHPAVIQAVVFGVPDAEWGHAVHAVVVAPHGDSFDEPLDGEALRRHCRLHLSGYKVPKRIEVVPDPLPTSGANKIDRQSVRRRYLAALGALEPS